jgi:hypothetical protein
MLAQRARRSCQLADRSVSCPAWPYLTGSRVSHEVLTPQYSWLSAQTQDAVVGSQRGSHPSERLPRQANGHGQPEGDHARWRTDPDSAERLTGNYGSGSCVRVERLEQAVGLFM